MSTPPSEQDSTSSSLLITDTIDNDKRSESVEIETLLEKQLLLEKTRCGQLTNDNQRLLSQNISLCQAIKQQKSEMINLQNQNGRLQQQVSKLFLSLTTLNKTSKQNSAKDAQIQKALKQEFDVLKDGLVQRDEEITILNQRNSKLTFLIEESKKEIESLKKINDQNQSEKCEYESIIKQHLDSIKEFNSTIDSLQTAMNVKEEEIDCMKKENDKLHKSVQSKDDEIKDILIENNTKTNEIRQQKEEINKLNNEIEAMTKVVQETKCLYNQSIDKMESVESKYDELCAEREWWKSEATTLEKECQLNMNEMHELKSKLNDNTNNKKYNKENFNILRKKCHLLYWKRFVEYLIFEHGMQQTNDVWMSLKNKYLKINKKKSNDIIENKRNLKESFKICMFKAVKDIKDLDIDKLLLCQDTAQLTDFILSSSMSAQTQLQVAAQLLPLVEKYRIDLQNDINVKIDKFIERSNNI